MPKELKIFHGILNYGTQAGLLSKGLREQGVVAWSYTKYEKYDRQTDYQFKNYNNIIFNKIYNYIINPIIKITCFFKYNTFHFYFGQSLFKSQIDIPFYRLFNKKVIMEYLGDDIRHYKTLVERYKLPLNHRFSKEMQAHDNKVKKRLNHEIKYIDYVISCLPSHVDYAKQYGVVIDEVVPLAIDLNTIKYVPMEDKHTIETVTILHAPTCRILKGTKYVESAIKMLVNNGYNINFRLIEGVSHDKLLHEYKKCDIFIDQISIGWYGTAALEAMAIGRTTCAFIDDRYYEYIDYSQDIPIVNINQLNVYDKLKYLLDNKHELYSTGLKSRQFVEKYHDLKYISKKLINIYQNKII